eukprot:6825225-Prymnesium_polylepis.1
MFCRWHCDRCDRCDRCDCCGRCDRYDRRRPYGRSSVTTSVDLGRPRSTSADLGRPDLARISPAERRAGRGRAVTVEPPTVGKAVTLGLARSARGAHA